MIVQNRRRLNRLNLHVYLSHRDALMPPRLRARRLRTHLVLMRRVVSNIRPLLQPNRQSVLSQFGDLVN